MHLWFAARAGTTRSGSISTANHVRLVSFWTSRADRAVAGRVGDRRDDYLTIPLNDAVLLTASRTPLLGHLRLTCEILYSPKMSPQDFENGEEFLACTSSLVQAKKKLHPVSVSLKVFACGLS